MKWLIVMLLLALPAFGSAASRPASEVLDYALTVSFDLNSSVIRGVARIPVMKGQQLKLQRGALKFTQATLSGKGLPISAMKETVAITAPDEGTIEIRYQGVFREPADNQQPSDVISGKGVVLTGAWYPKPDQMCTYRLRAVLPPGFEAISEAETIEKSPDPSGTLFTFDFSHPVDSINLIASDRYRVVKDRAGDVDIYAYFFHEDRDLVPTYLSQTRRYLQLYSELAGKFPYKRFSVVENFLPTGYSMPTYTLLGQQVVRLPFIPETSLGHEILHQWLGNLVYIDYAKGNWAEGLTTFLTDHLYEQEKGRGELYRKGVLIGYMSYVNEKNEFPLRAFVQKTDQVSEAIGYGKAVMVFQMLQDMVGKERFYQSIRDFIKEMRFRKASWEDIRRAFEGNYGKDLSWFFGQWIDRKGLPELQLEGAEVKGAGTSYEVTFDIRQGKHPFILDLPVLVSSRAGKTTEIVRLSGEKQRFRVATQGVPERVVIDDGYRVGRRLSLPEFPPVIARLLGDEKRTVIAGGGGGETYRRIMDFFEEKGDTLRRPHRIGPEDLKDHSLVILGDDNPLARQLFGRVETPGGFSVVIKENPWNPWKVAGVFNGRSAPEVNQAFQKVFHYGKYSALSFDRGVNVSKTTDESQMGIVKPVATAATAVDISRLETLPAVMERISGKRIIYVGEVHDRFSDHLMQLQIIKDLHRRGKRIAIGMEMFQRPFQHVLDQYIAGKIDERAFLKGTEYFKRWRFDYALYRPILLFARSAKIPVIALNQKQEIVDKVFRGGLESLSEEEKKWVPTAMDFSDDAYRERLTRVFHVHEGFEKASFDFFYQAQILWDETMAQSVDQFMKTHTMDHMVVLAGNGHLAFRSGIPKRVARRNGDTYAVVLNDAEVEPGIADFVLFPGNVPGGASPVLMVQLKETGGKLEIAGFPPHSVSEKAGMKAGDMLLAIDGAPVVTFEDVKLDLLARKKGDTVNVKIMRKAVLGAKEMDFNVVLQ